MKYLILLSLLCFNCSENKKKIVTEEKGQEMPIFVTEEPAIYKSGTNEQLIKSIYTSIAGQNIESPRNTKGIYQFEIDTFGATSKFEIIRSVTNKIDAEIEKICDTLEFHTATLNGKAINSKFTLPIQVEFR